MKLFNVFNFAKTTFYDNSVSGLSSENVQDVIDELSGQTGNTEEQAEMHFTVNNLITVIVGTFAPIKISGLTTAGVVTSQFSHSNGRLTKTSAGSKNYKVHAEFNADKLGGGSDGYVFYIAKNGTLVNKSEKEVRLTSQEKSISLQSIIPMAQNDYIEIWVEGIDDDDNILVIDLNVTIRK